MQKPYKTGSLRKLAVVWSLKSAFRADGLAGISSLLAVVNRAGLIGLASRIGSGYSVNVGSEEREEYLVVFGINFEESGKREAVPVLFLFQVLISLIIDYENRVLRNLLFFDV
nr:hypothetical protein [Tanacetum cinerariifolium]